MRAVLPLFFLVIGTLPIFAQPANDNCNTAISLGTVPACPTTPFTNVNATASNIGANNSPDCFNGGVTQRDVWFTFTTAADMRQVTIALKSVANGPNARGIRNPQIALYRGTCTGLSEIGCISAPNNSTEVRLDALNLTPNVTYYLRVNDYSASATPNAGDFNLCVQPYVPAINMGDTTSSTSCSGTLYDSGGPDGEYDIFEDYTFTICPTEPHACIEINVEEFDIEPSLIGILGDQLTFYAGVDVDAPVLAVIDGQDIGSGFRIQTSTPCITVRFESDFSTNYDGFKLTWQCSAAPCNNRSFGNPLPIASLPFSQSVSTCESASTTVTSPCGADAFLRGPEYVFAYTSPSNACIGINISGAAEGTGLLVLDGLPSDSATNCVARSSNGFLRSVNLLAGSTYYIVVANASGCTPFDIQVAPAECGITPSLAGALCNPLNGCVQVDGLPTVFDFQNGFQDLQIVNNVNNGCWLSTGVEPRFYWFTVQAQANGNFGFILNSANPDTLSDLDFNVWGPFTQEQACENPQQVINFIRSNQPLRSSWSPDSGPTGLVDVHPTLGYAITDEYDCGNTPGADGDDYVRTIPARQGEVYVVLINDWENLISNDGVAIDWSPSNPQSLEPLPLEIVAGDTAVCRGDSVQIEIASPIRTIRWISDTTTLSCTRCPNPVARPSQTTDYTAVVEAVCYNDTITVQVQVFDLDAGPDVTVCRGEQFERTVGEAFANATYRWIVPANIQLSCTNCPNPTIITSTPGTYPLIVTLTAPGCTLRDTFTVTVRAELAPPYTIVADTAICEGATVNIGGAATTGVTYRWTSNPVGFASTAANPSVMPSETTTYVLQATNATCPLASLDSVRVTVVAKPVIRVVQDTSVCQEQPILLGRVTPQQGVVYSWTGPDTIANAADPNTLAYPTTAGEYILTATTADSVCTVTDTVAVQITPIDIDIQLDDTVQVCRGVPLGVGLNVVPANTPIIFASTDDLLRDTLTTDSIILRPDRLTTYIATLNSSGCVRMDTLVVLVDSLPANLAIMPGDTTVCQGSLVLLTSEIFEPKDFPNIEFNWVPTNGQQTPDSLYNMVISADTTTRYYRITTSGVCVDSSFADVTVNPIPIVQIVPSDTSVCPGSPVRFEVTTIPADVEKPMWEPATGLSCVECLEPTATVFTNTEFTLNVEYQGCPGSGSATITVPIPAFDLTDRTVLCLGDSVRLNTVATPGVVYTWTSSTDPNFRSNDPRLVVRPTQTTTYRLVAQVPNCQPVEAQLTITVIQPTTVTISGDSTLCPGQSLNLTAVSTAPANVPQSYRWEVNGQVVSTNATLSVDSVTQNRSVRLTYTYGNNCGVIVRNLNISVQSLSVDVQADPDSVFRGQTVTLTAVTNPPVLSGATYAWTANDETISGNGPTTQHTPTENPTVYKVQVSTPDGCTPASDSVRVVIKQVNVRIPNAFTPNGDGKNDTFIYLTEDIITGIDFRIYNRWGQLVFQSRTLGESWDGRHNGKDAPSDVYVYVLVFQDEGGAEQVRKGDVTLIR